MSEKAINHQFEGHPTITEEANEARAFDGHESKQEHGGSAILVNWEEPASQDPANPLNWSPARKWGTIGILSFIVFLTPLASAAFAPGVPLVQEEFNNHSVILATFVVSVFVLGFAVGPLFLAPLSEMYGRVPVYHVCNVLFIVFTVACAVASSIGQLVAFRFLAGFAGVASVTIGGGSIADMVPREQRARAISAYTLGPLLGPIVGPIVGGFLVEDKGWRWVFWLVAILAAAITIVAFIVFRESYPPVLLARKTQQLRKSTGNHAYRSALDTGETNSQRLKNAMIRPLKLLIFSLPVTLLSIYIAILYGLSYILFTTFTFVYEGVYGFSPSSAGLAFLGSGVGTLLGLAYVSPISDKVVKKAIAEKGSSDPEDRLPLVVTVPATLAIPAGFFLYGWAAEMKYHWIVPQVGNALAGFGTIAVLTCVQTYLIDAYTQHAASVIAANAVLRSLLGALLPLFGLRLYDVLGLGWGNSLLGFLALAFAPILWLFKIYGRKIRGQ
ncbi:major facilitator superfamily domain-containing protein [Xylariaceae sp. FL1272]|nr:major facilitator superfamily domain-containing protein [Xylariaceae sp. FL1272]